MKKTGLLTAVALVCLAVASSSALAQGGTPEQQQSCTDDAFRLCQQFIPGVAKITACMQRNYSQLSPACKKQFHK